MTKKRIVVKIGSSSLIDKTGKLSHQKLSEHAESIAYLKNQGHEVILISSGAISIGLSGLGYRSRPVTLTLTGRQAAAAVGQGLLMQAYTEAFHKHGVTCSQLLLTRSIFLSKEQYSNVYATLTELLKRSVVPIINENDTVTISKLTFGNNDIVCALVSGLIHADFLVMLTDINGIYKKDEQTHKFGERYDFLSEISEEHFRQTKDSNGSKFGTGGMKSKLSAARTALSLGVNVFIGTGSGREKLLQIIEGNGDGTYIGNQQTRILDKPKQWIAIHSLVSGKIFIDRGAEKAILEQGRSLLPVGIKGVEGTFHIGNVVDVLNQNQEIIARGEVNYSSDELKKIKGMASKMAMMETKRNRPEVIHRNRLVIKPKEEWL